MFFLTWGPLRHLLYWAIWHRGMDSCCWLKSAELKSHTWDHVASKNGYPSLSARAYCMGNKTGLFPRVLLIFRSFHSHVERRKQRSWVNVWGGIRSPGPFYSLKLPRLSACCHQTLPWQTAGGGEGVSAEWLDINDGWWGPLSVSANHTNVVSLTHTD